MKRTFIFKEGSSQKFWSIEIIGTGFTVNYGKLNTTGQSSSKSFETKEKCQKEADKLIAEKVKKGYQELTNSKVIPERSILEGATFNYGFEIKVKPQLTLFKKSINLKKITLKAGHIEDGITSEQKQAFEKLQKLLSKNMPDVEKAIIQYYIEAYKDSNWRIFYEENYGKDLFEGELTAEKMQNELEDPVYVVINREGETVLLMAQQIEPDNGLAVILFPMLEVLSQDEWL